MQTITFDQLPETVTQLFEKVENIERLLIQKTSVPQPDSDQLLTIELAGKFLNLSVATLYDRVHKQTIPVCKRAGTKRLYFSKKALTDYILQGKRPTIAEVQEQADNYIANRKKK